MERGIVAKRENMQTLLSVLTTWLQVKVKNLRARQKVREEKVLYRHHENSTELYLPWCDPDRLSMAPHRLNQWRQRYPDAASDNSRVEIDSWATLSNIETNIDT